MAEKSFEERMSNLETIKRELEKDDLSLDEAVQKFEDGMKISRECREENNYFIGRGRKGFCSIIDDFD